MILRTRAVFAVAVLLVLPSAADARVATSRPVPITVSDGEVRLELTGGTANGLSAQAISAGGRPVFTFVEGDAAQATWSVELKVSGLPRAVRRTSADASDWTTSERGGVRSTTWMVNPRNVGAPCSRTGCVRVTLEWQQRGGRDVASRLHVENSDRSVAVMGVDYPVLTFRVDKALEPSVECVMPQSKGRLLRDPLNNPAYDDQFKKGRAEFRYTYPARGIMPFFACTAAGHGFMVQDEDPAAFEKEFHFQLDRRGPRAGGRTGRIFVRRSARNLGATGEGFRMEGWSILSPLSGDWYDAARRYRRWALTQPWMSKGPLARRADVPEWYRDAPVTFATHALDARQPASVVGSAVQRFQRTVGWPAGAQAPLFWYGWQDFQRGPRTAATSGGDPGGAPASVYCQSTRPVGRAAARGQRGRGDERRGRGAPREDEQRGRGALPAEEDEPLEGVDDLEVLGCDEDTLPSANAFSGTYVRSRPGLKDAVSQLSRAGVHTVLFLSTTLFDQGFCPGGRCSGANRALWDELQKHVMRDDKGNPRTHSKKHPVLEVDRADPWWQARFLDLARRHLADTGARGVYLDTLGGMRHRNFEPPPGLPRGGGDYMGINMRSFAAAQQRLKQEDRSRVLVDENGPDYLVDMLDGTVTHENFLPDTIPLRQAALHDHWLSTGRQLADADLDQPLAFERIAGTLFADGQQLGRIEVPLGRWRLVDDPRHEPQRRYLQDLIAARWNHRRWLATGDMLRPPRIDAGEGVMANAWRAADGSVGVVLTNWSDRPARGRLQLALDEYLPGSGRVRATPLAGTRAPQVLAVGGDLTFDAPPRSVFVWQLEADGGRSR